MLIRSIVVLLTAAIGVNAITLLRSGLNITTKAEKEDCDFRLWVRADDLAPLTIIEGDVRLLNNMTNLSLEMARACRIIDWSLYLRYRERGAIQIPISNVKLPEKPAYNYSWGESIRGNQDYTLNRMLSNGEDVTSLLVESVKNPHEAEIQNYHQQLEEYVKALSNADKWIIRDDEITFFEASINMFSPPEVMQGEFCRLQLMKVTLISFCRRAACDFAFRNCCSQCTISRSIQ